jgi:hypothetical protein
MMIMMILVLPASAAALEGECRWDSIIDKLDRRLLRLAIQLLGDDNANDMILLQYYY